MGAELVVQPGGHVEVGGDQRTHVVRFEVEPVGDLDALTGRQVDPFDGHRLVGTLVRDCRRRLAFADDELRHRAGRVEVAQRGVTLRRQLPESKLTGADRRQPGAVRRERHLTDVARRSGQERLGEVLGVEQVDEVVEGADRQPSSVGAELGRLRARHVESVDLLAAVEIEDHDLVCCARHQRQAVRGRIDGDPVSTSMSGISIDLTTSPVSMSTTRSDPGSSPPAIATDVVPGRKPNAVPGPSEIGVSGESTAQTTISRLRPVGRPLAPLRASVRPGGTRAARRSRPVPRTLPRRGRWAPRSARSRVHRRSRRRPRPARRRPDRTPDRHGRVR